MLSILALGAFENLLNRIINLDNITRIQLNALQGQSLRVVIDNPNISIDVLFDQDKIRFEPTSLGQATQPSLFEQRPFDTQFTVKNVTATLHVANIIALSKLLLSEPDQLSNIPLQGDYHLLFSLKEIIANTELDLGAHLSPWIGATLAHEIGKIQHVPKQMWNTAKGAEFMLSDGLKEDTGIFAARWQMQDLQKQTRHLEQELDRLEASVLQLSQHAQFQPK